MDEMRLYAPNELGRDGYPMEWHTIVKHAVRAAAGHRCVRCSHPYEDGAGEWSPCDKRCTHGGLVRALIDGEVVATNASAPAGWHHHLLSGGGVVQAAWRILTVHHLTGCWGRTEDAKRDLRWWNLAALCQRCHLQIQGKVDLHRVWPHEHSEWFKPYVAGWYAWSYLREELERPEVEARLDELLALERMEVPGGS